MALPALSSPPTNAFGLYQYVAQRIPGYDPSEYLRELNSSYVHVWEEISKLRVFYFTSQQQLKVETAGTTFDLLYNQAEFGEPGGGTLSAALSNRLYQVLRIRVQPPAGGLFQSSTAIPFNSPDFLSVAANPTSTPTQTGPYYWYPIGRGSIQFALPLAIGTTLEFTYVSWPIAMNFLYGGTVSSSGLNAVTGVGTNFTQIVLPDFQAFLPEATAPDQEQIQLELVCNTNSLYRVTDISSDTTLSTQNNIGPMLTGAPYVLATLPEIPREHIRVIASITTQKMYSIDGDDARSTEWTGIAEKNIQMMKDSLQERQGQDPPRKIRFRYGIGRRNRTFLR